MRALMFRSIVFTSLLVGGVSDVQAQNQSGLRNVRGRHIAVIDADSREWQGKLLEIASDAIIVEVQSTPRRFDLSKIKRVDSHGDHVYDGAIKGGVFGAVIGALSLGARGMAGGALTYSLIGLGLDALNDCNHTVYRATPVESHQTAAPQLRLKFSW